MESEFCRHEGEPLMGSRTRTHNGRIVDPGWAFGASVRLTKEETEQLLQIVLPVADRAHKYV
jgi:hypothetical protein